MLQKDLAFKDNAQIISCVTKINSILIDNIQDLDNQCIIFRIR